MTLYNSIRAEILKLRYPPIVWLTGFIICIVLAIVFTGYYIDVNRAILLGRNPWNRLNGSIEAVFSLFIAVPFVVFLISSAVHIENQNHGFKQLYALPQSRTALLLNKLMSLLLFVLFSVLILLFGQILIGYTLNVIYPESEFVYFEFPLQKMLLAYFQIVISLLGIIGIQFFLSFRFRGFLLPASIGIIGYIIGSILSSLNTPISFFFPFCYPGIARNREMFDSSTLNIDQVSILNKIEGYSILVFVLFIGLTIFFEKRKRI